MEKTSYNKDYVPNPSLLELQVESTCIALQSFHVIKPQDSVYYVIPSTRCVRQSSKELALCP